MDAPARLPMRLHMRTRPGMYVGGLNRRALRYILDDIVREQLAVREARPEQVRCTIGADGTCAVEVLGGAVAALKPEDFLPDHYDAAPTDRFMSLAIACAFSDRLDAEVVRDGRRWTQLFAAGLATGPLQTAATADPPLVRVRYRPDASLFKTVVDPGFLALCGRAREWAAFHPRTRFTVEDGRDGQRRDYHYPAGLLSLAEELEHESYGSPDYRTWRCELSDPDGSAAEAVFVYRFGTVSIVHSFVNGLRTLDEGTHVETLRHAVAEAVAGFGDDAPIPFCQPDRRDALAGLVVLLSVRLHEPNWGSPTRFLLDDKRAAEVVRRMIATQFHTAVETAGLDRPG